MINLSLALVSVVMLVPLGGHLSGRRWGCSGLDHGGPKVALATMVQ